MEALNKAVAERSEELFLSHRERIFKQTDRLFIG